MVTYTTNKGYGEPTVGGDLNAWGPFLNTNFSTLDSNLGGTVSVNVAGAANVTLNATQAKNLYIKLTGLLTGNITVFLPAAGGLYVIENNTTGLFTVMVQTTALGAAVNVLQTYRAAIITDGTHVRLWTDLTSKLGVVGAATIGTSLLVGTTGAFGGVLTAADGTTGDQVVNNSQFSRSLTLPGFQTFPGGLALQWGLLEPISVPASALSFFTPYLTLIGVGAFYLGTVGPVVSVTSRTTSGFVLNSNATGAGTGAFWISLGLLF